MKDYIEAYKGKKILILAGAPVHCKVVETAHRMGVYTIVTDYLQDSPAKMLADEKWMLNITDVDAIVEKCREEKIDGVLNFCIDPAQKPYQRICEKLDIPCYGNRKQFDIMTDKIKFKSFCQSVGLDTIPEYSLDEVKKGNVEFPLLVKPAASRGSRGQKICWTMKDVEDAVEFAKDESENAQYIIEKCMIGKPDFSVTYLVCNGIPYLERTCDRYLGRVEDNLNTQCVGCIAPSKYSDFYLEKIHKKVCSFIKKLEIKNGPIFMQGFIDGDTIRFYDPGLRFPGGEYELLLEKVTGVNLMSMLIEYALTGEIKEGILPSMPLYILNNHYTIQLPITARPGKIVRFNNLKEMYNNPNVVKVFNRYNEGEVVPATGDVRQRVCEIALVVDESKEVAESILWVQSKLEVLDEKGENMLVSLMDTDMLKY